MEEGEEELGVRDVEDFHGEELEGNSKASGGRLLQDKVEGRSTREVRTGHVTTCIQCSQKV